MRALRSIQKLSAIAALCTGALLSQASQAGIVQFEAAPATPFSIGDSFSLKLFGSDFASTLDGGGINLSFDPTVLRVTSVTVDTTVWEFFSSDGEINDALGTVADVWFASFEERVGSFDIALFTFQAFGAGNSALTLSESLFNPFASGGELLPVEFGSLFVQVASKPPTDPTDPTDPVPLPLPSTLALLAPAALLSLRRRVRAS
jgi:hypothetical protein